MLCCGSPWGCNESSLAPTGSLALLPTRLTDWRNSTVRFWIVRQKVHSKFVQGSSKFFLWKSPLSNLFWRALPQMFQQSRTKKGTHVQELNCGCWTDEENTKRKKVEKRSPHTRSSSRGNKKKGLITTTDGCHMWLRLNFLPWELDLVCGLHFFSFPDGPVKYIQ